jgi:hypothetical protein
MSFANALFAAIAAAVLSAQMAAGVFGGSLAGGLFFLIAPFPILLVGFAILPLAGLASALIAALLIASLNPSSSPLAYLLVIGLPAFAAAWLSLVRSNSPYADSDGFLNPGTISVAIVMMLALASVGATMIAEPDFNKVAAMNRAVAAEAVRTFLSEMPGMRGGISQDEFIDSLAVYGPLASMLMIQSVFLFLTYLAARLARQWNKLARPWPDFARVALPVAGLSVMGASILAAMLGGWIGLFAGYLFVGLLVLTILIGLAVLHYRARNLPQTRWMVPAAWVAVVILSPFTLMLPALFIAGLGIADHVFDFRGLRRVQRP